MTLCGNLGSVWEAAIDVGITASGRCVDEDALRQPRRGLLVRWCFVWVARLAVVVCPMWSCSMTTLVYLYGFSVGSPANELVNSFRLFKIKRGKIARFVKKKKTESAIDSAAVY